MQRNPERVEVSVPKLPRGLLVFGESGSSGAAGRQLDQGDRVLRIRSVD
jgi:hypothetical protein